MKTLERAQSTYSGKQAAMSIPSTKKAWLAYRMRKFTNTAKKNSTAWSRLTSIFRMSHVSGRQSEEEITFFKSVGVAVQDAMAAQLALKNARKMGLGQNHEND